jgi:WD40 repeat protein
MEGLQLASAGDDIKLWDCGNDFSLLHNFNPHGNNNIASVAWNLEGKMFETYLRFCFTCSVDLWTCFILIVACVSLFNLGNFCLFVIAIEYFCTFKTLLADRAHHTQQCLKD